MGCSSSQSAEQSANGSGGCRMFKVTVLNSRGEESCSGQLEVTFQDLILTQKGKDQVQWPLWSLRRYGCDKDLFLFESGRRCPTGPGRFAFRCQQAEALFNLLHLSVVWAGQSQNNRLSTITESDPQSAVLNEICQEFRAGENLMTTDGTGPSYINDPARFKYYNVLGRWRDDVCRPVDYADLELPPSENYDSAENENLANKHSYINVGSNGQRPQYVNVPINGVNRRPYINVPAVIQRPFSVQHSMAAGKQSRRPKSLEWQPFHARPFEDSGYLNPRSDLLVGRGVNFPSSSLNQIRMNEAGDRKRNDILPIQDDKPGYATIDFDRPLPVGSRRRSYFDDGLRRTHHSCEIETMYYC